MPAEFRPVQTVFEFIAAGLLVAASVAGLWFAVDADHARSAATDAREAGGDIGVLSVLATTALAYALGVLADDVTRLLFEERALERLKAARLARLKADHPDVFADSGIGPGASNDELFGFMRMYVLRHSTDLYAEVTNQITRLRLSRVIVGCLLIGDAALLIAVTKQPSAGLIATTALVAATTYGGIRAMRRRFSRYVRAVERSFLVLRSGGSDQRQAGADVGHHS